MNQYLILAHYTALAIGLATAVLAIALDAYRWVRRRRQTAGGR